MQSKLLIIIPAYNEAENIERVVDDLIQNSPQYDYLIITDGSRDATREICRRKGYRFVDLPINVGLTDGVQTGMMYAYRHGYDYALQFDGDGQHDPEYIRRVAEPIEKGEADIVIGSRFIDKEGFQSTGIRRVGIKFLSRLRQFSELLMGQLELALYRDITCTVPVRTEIFIEILHRIQVIITYHESAL